MRYRTCITAAGLTALLVFVSGSAFADIGVERTPAGQAGMDQLDRGLDSRARQSELLSDQLERQHQRLNANRHRDTRYGSPQRTDRPRTQRERLRSDP